MAAAERVVLEPGWVLHGRSFRESSGLIEAFTPGHGRVSLVARGLKRPGSPLRGLLQPFRPLLLSWGGRDGGLSTLHAAEAGGPLLDLPSEALMPGFYLNELLLRLLHKGDPHPALYADYGGALSALAEGQDVEVALRRFEIALLAEIGYGLQLEHEAGDGRPLEAAIRYDYVADVGAVRRVESAEGEGFRGSDLLAIARDEWSAASTRVAARRLLRAVLAHHLGDQPLRTRTVYAALRGRPEP